MSYSDRLARFAESRTFSPIGGATKRAFDVVAAFVGIVALLPLFAGCYLAVRATSRGPVLFRHARIGYRGREFWCLKFRTMEVDAERRLQDHLARNADARREWQANQKLKDDPRITLFGQFLRRSSLDELPQLFNVLMGDMSMVGPRPIVAEELEKYRQHFGVYATARPGLTGLWQVNGRNRTTYAERVAYDVDYVRNWSFIGDIRILVVTIAHVFDWSGAY